MTPQSVNSYLGLSPQDAAAGQLVAMAGTSQQSTAIGTAGSISVTVWVDLYSDTECFIEIGSNPTAVANTSYRLGSYLPYRLPITAGSKIAVLPVSGSTGNLWIHPVS